MTYVFIDTETGGLDPKVHGITEIGAVAFELDPQNPLRDGIRDELRVLVQPNKHLAYTPYALELQDRTLEYLGQYGDSECIAWMKLRMFLDKHVLDQWSGHIVAQYAQFDYGFLAELAERVGDTTSLLSKKRCEWICTKHLFRTLSGLGVVKAKGCGMHDIMSWYGLEFEGKAHTALTDAHAGVKVFRKMLADLKKYYGGNE